MKDSRVDSVLNFASSLPMVIGVSTILVAIGVLAFAQTNPAHSPTAEAPQNQSITREELEVILAKVIEVHFTDLKDVSISIDYFKSETDFFRAWVSLPSSLKHRKNRNYVLKVNVGVHEAQDLSADAIEAIVAHELCHIQDYTNSGPTALVKTLSLYTRSTSINLARYERSMDECALEKGYAAGLKKYREWIYRQVSEKDGALKKKTYYTPEEIDAWSESNRHISSVADPRRSISPTPKKTKSKSAPSGRPQGLDTK